MRTLKLVTPEHPLYVEAPKDSVDHVYSAIEYVLDDEQTALPVVCYRTKDGVTHQAVVTVAGGYTIRKSVKPFGK